MKRYGGPTAALAAEVRVMFSRLISDRCPFCADLRRLRHENGGSLDDIAHAADCDRMLDCELRDTSAQAVSTDDTPTPTARRRGKKSRR